MSAAEITVLSWAGGWGRALREAVSEPFERETGIRVKHQPHVGLKLPPGLGSEACPLVDVVWCNAVPALRAAAEGACAPLELAAPAELRPRARPEGAEAFVVFPYVVYYVLVYHEDVFPSGAPESWRVLLDPRHRGRIALYPGGNGFFPIAQLLGGGRLEDIPARMEPCWAALRALRPQVGELEYSVGREERLRARKLELCVRALTNALAFRAAGVPVGWCVPREGTADTVDALWIPRGVPEDRRALARRYLGFALRRDVQEAWCARLGAMPVHADAEVPELLRARTDLPAHADDHRGILRLPEELKLRHEPEWEARWNAIYS